MPNHLWTALFARHEGAATPFLHLPEGGTWTHGDFTARAARMASVLAARGVRPGDRVAVQVAKSPDALALYAACVRGGFAFLPLNTAYTPNELDYFISDAEAALLVCDPGTLDLLRPVAEAAGARIATVVDARVHHPSVGDLGTPMMGGRTTYNHSPSDLKAYCMARNNTLNLREYRGWAHVLAFWVKTIWFYLLTRPEPGRVVLSARAAAAGLRGDFTGHRRYLR